MKRSNQIQTVIPDLVSIETKLRFISGFYLSEGFDFYKPSLKPLPFHYTIKMDNNIEIPTIYDFRNGYHFKLGHTWYYSRKVGPLHLKFGYDSINKVFKFNKAYSLIPTELGGIIPVGKMIADIINLDLFLNSYILFHGCGIKLNNQSICLIGLGYNGKTTFVHKGIKKGAKYIAEDMLIINFEKDIVYPTAPFSRIYNFARHTNRQLTAAIENDKIINKPIKLDNLYLIQNITNPSYSGPDNDKSLYDYLIPCSISFLKNNLVKSIIFNENYTDELFKKINDFKNIKRNYKYINLNTFNFEILFENNNE